jgi:inorganic pyrophosphatase
MASNPVVKSLADPTRLAPLQAKDQILQVVVETPAKSRNKFAFDPKQEVFTLKSVLPAGMVFPYDFGFLPRTKAGDGDPVDVLLLMDEPAFPGVAVRARLIGVIEGEQIDGKKKIRNDRLVAVSEATHQYAKIKNISDLPKKWIKELEIFFVNYHNLEGKQYRLLGVKGPKAGMHLFRANRKG